MLELQEPSVEMDLGAEAVEDAFVEEVFKVEEVLVEVVVVAGFVDVEDLTLDTVVPVVDECVEDWLEDFTGEDEELGGFVLDVGALTLLVFVLEDATDELELDTPHVPPIVWHPVPQ
jgi:hypothetical protein